VGVLGGGLRIRGCKVSRPYVRKTVDVWRVYVNYGQGWEHECTEMSREEMKVNRQAYRENCPYPIRIRKGRDKVDTGVAGGASE